MNREEPARTRRLRCPRCGSEIAWNGNPHRPFCSLSCRLIDLGVWLDERYRIPGPDLPSESTADDGTPREGG
ncbi:MAG TPA: DNA gyrase inhibitor YacG [Methylomirabilota bacterium]|nr:DNA gyrase inhibitor YacG [Methylomirabilota bacterium]